VIYTGTHDNNTTLGWIKDETAYNKKFFAAYSGCSSDTVEDKFMAMLRMALSSVSFLCIIPMQDLLMLDSDSRMNRPGTIGDNWGWRFDWKQVDPETISRISGLITLYQR
jgi:4-alpha-glucanotransferase